MGLNTLSRTGNFLLRFVTKEAHKVRNPTITGSDGQLDGGCVAGQADPRAETLTTLPRAGQFTTLVIAGRDR